MGTEGALLPIVHLCPPCRQTPLRPLPGRPHERRQWLGRSWKSLRSREDGIFVQNQKRRHDMAEATNPMDANAASAMHAASAPPRAQATPVATTRPGLVTFAGVMMFLLGGFQLTWAIVE